MSKQFYFRDYCFISKLKLACW